jgi:hypothetical protein
MQMIFPLIFSSSVFMGNSAPDIFRKYFWMIPAAFLSFRQRFFLLLLSHWVFFPSTAVKSAMREHVDKCSDNSKRKSLFIFMSFPFR